MSLISSLSLHHDPSQRVGELAETSNPVVLKLFLNAVNRTKSSDLRALCFYYLLLERRAGW